MTKSDLIPKDSMKVVWVIRTIFHEAVVGHAMIVLPKQIRYHVSSLMSHEPETILAGK